MRRFVLRGFLAVLIVGSMMSPLGAAQTPSFKVLHSFASGSDGAYPTTPLVFDRLGNLYGVTSEGDGTGCSSNGCGSAFELLQKNGRWGYRILLGFSSTNNFFPNPIGSLVTDGNGSIYGTDSSTGDPFCNCGAVFQLTNTNGVWMQNILHNFLGGSDGQYPSSGLASDSVGNLYGATERGGTYDRGTIFQLAPNPDGTWSFSVIYSFGSGFDGSFPLGSLSIDKSANIYGTTGSGGFYSYGTVFKLAPSNGSWTESTLYNLTLEYGYPQQAYGVVAGADGALYGNATSGGVYQLGTVYKLTASTPYWKRTVLHTFSGNNEGAVPYGTLAIDRFGNLYGTTNLGGTYGYGTAYRLVSGQHGQWKEQTLHNFRSTDGSGLSVGLVLDEFGNLFGVTSTGGTYGRGVAFEIQQQ